MDQLWIWIALNLFVLAMLAVDLLVFHKEAHEVSLKEAAGWSIVWVALASSGANVSRSLNGRIEFDPRKSDSNLKKHGIDFVTTQPLWSDPDRLEISARSLDEPRSQFIGRIGNMVWSAFITMRRDRSRIISVRPARDEEKAAYIQDEGTLRRRARRDARCRHRPVGAHGSRQGDEAGSSGSARERGLPGRPTARDRSGGSSSK